MVCAVGSPAEGGPGEAVGGADEGDDGGVGDAVLGGLPGQGFDEFRFAGLPGPAWLCLFGVALLPVGCVWFATASSSSSAGAGSARIRQCTVRRPAFHVAVTGWSFPGAFQEQVLAGPPPLGPGAPPLDRLIAYGRARIDFLIGHREIARAALDGREQIPAGSQTPMSREHIRFLPGEMSLGAADLDVLATQLTAALDGPLLLYLSSAILTQAAPQVSERLAEAGRT